MRTCFNFILFIFVMELPAQKVPHVSISNTAECRWNIAEFDFDDYACTKINNDYRYTFVLWYVANDMVETDSLVFMCIDFDKMSVKSISFSRNGTSYLSAHSFPRRDSVKWKRIIDGNSCRDSLVLRDSLLYYRLEPYTWGNDFVWYLEGKQRFSRLDTLNLLLDEKPTNLRSNTLERFRKSKSDECASHNRCNQILLIDKKTPFMRPLEPQLILFELNGRRHTALTAGSGTLFNMGGSRQR